MNATYLTYFIEIRKRLLRSLVLLLVVMVAVYAMADELMEHLLVPMAVHLPMHSHVIATSVPATILTQIKLSFLLSLIITMPFYLLEFWRFVTPALYPIEKRLLWKMMGLSLCFFYLGLGISHYALMPLLYGFMIRLIPESVQLMPDISLWLSFHFRMLLAFGVISQIPVLMICLTHFKLVDKTTYKQIRPYVIVFAFVVGMLLTPPDVLSQLTLALPICMLYELGIALSPSGLKNDANHEKACVP